MKQITKVLLIGSSLWYLGEGMLGPLFTLFAQDIGGDILEISWAWATYLFVLGILTIVFGKYADKWNKEKMMIWGYGLNALFTFGYLLVSKPIHLFIIQAGLGLALALASPTWSDLFAKYHDKKNSGFVYGIANGVPSIVIGISIIIGGTILHYFSYDVLFIVMGTLQVVATIYQAKILKI